MWFEVHSTTREQFIDITDMIVEGVKGSDVTQGAVMVFCPHTTAAVTINENADPDVLADLKNGLARMAPRAGEWRHREGNSDGHLKSSLVGASVILPLEGGRLVLGTWQGVYLCEFDGPRTRKVHVSLLSGAS